MSQQQQPNVIDTDTKGIVITGSTRGLGFGLADAFLAAGHSVVVSGRSGAAVDGAVARLTARHGEGRVFGVAADVTDADDVELLFATAERVLGRVDVWINNAGAGAPALPLQQQSAQELAAVVQTNVLGTVLGTRVAVAGMTRTGSGRIFNVEGFGSDGKQRRTGMAAYGASKSAVRAFTHAIAGELEGSGVRIATLHPGVVVTDMLIEQVRTAPPAQSARAKRFYNVIADPVETAAAALVASIMRNDTRNGGAISRFSLPKMLVRFLSPSFRSRDVFARVFPGDGAAHHAPDVTDAQA